MIDGYFDPGQHYGLVVGRKGWHPGVVGIVASRLVSRYHRPAVVVALAALSPLLLMVPVLEVPEAETTP